MTLLRTAGGEDLTRPPPADRSVTWANIGILCGTVLLPFPTAVLADAFRTGDRADEQTATMLYAALAVAMTLAWLVLFLACIEVRVRSWATTGSHRGKPRCAGRSWARSDTPAAPSSDS